MRRLLALSADGGIPQGIRRILILPIPTARDKLHLTGTDKLVSEVLDGVGEGDLVVGYGIPAPDTDYINEAGALVYDGARDERFLSQNAEITALGALGYILTEIPKIPADLRFGVVGYGRIGRALVRQLLFLGASVRVYTSKNLTRVELGECGVECMPIFSTGEVLPALDTLDVLVNTAPTPLGDAFVGGVIPKGLRVVELASGKNFIGVEGVEYLPSLPDKMYPTSAALAYFEGVKRFIREVVR